MGGRTKVFVSHSHNDGRFTARLVNDIEAAGAEVWVDTKSIFYDDFIRRINEGLADREWLILVMTPDALQSEWVRAEVDAAILLCRQRRMRGIIPILAEPCDENDIPPLWAVFQRYDATQDYDQAVGAVLNILGLTSPIEGAPAPPFTPEEEALFAPLVAAPSLESLQTLEAHEFRRFCAYVFTKAGYVVRLPGSEAGTKCDLYLGVNPDVAGLPLGYVLIQTEATTKVSGVAVRKAREAISSLRSILFYIIARSEFEPRAYSEIAATPHLHLFDGSHLIRYITYLTTMLQGVATSVPISPDILLAADRIRRRPTNTTKVLAVANNRGGVGKTTTAFNLAFELAHRGQRILLVDMDEQENLSSILLDRRSDHTMRVNIADYFCGRCSLSDLVIPTVNEHIWLIPADKTLPLIHLPTSPNTELQFTTELHDEGLRPHGRSSNVIFDWIILDTHPALTLYVQSAMAASHYLLTVTDATAWSSKALNHVLATLRSTKMLTGLDPRILGCLLNRWEDNASSQAFAASLGGMFQTYGMRLLQTRIPNIRNHARIFRQPDILRGKYRPTSVYARLVDEILAQFESI